MTLILKHDGTEVSIEYGNATLSETQELCRQLFLMFYKVRPELSPAWIVENR